MSIYSNFSLNYAQKVIIMKHKSIFNYLTPEAHQQIIDAGLDLTEEALNNGDSTNHISEGICSLMPNGDVSVKFNNLNSGETLKSITIDKSKLKAPEPA